MLYTLLDIPTDLQPWKLREVDRLRNDLAVDTTERGGVLRWKSNDRPVPISCFRDALAVPPVNQADGVDHDTQAFLKEYRKRDPKPSREDRAEMRANFPAGTVLVNVVTGRRIPV